MTKVMLTALFVLMGIAGILLCLSAMMAGPPFLLGAVFGVFALIIVVVCLWAVYVIWWE